MKNVEEFTKEIITICNEYCGDGGIPAVELIGALETAKLLYATEVVYDFIRKNTDAGEG